MKRVTVLVGLLVAGWSLLGCSGGTDAPSDEKKEGDKAAAASAESLEIDTSDPKQVVMGLIEAMKSGDQEGTSALLTSKACQETSKHGMQVAPTAMPDATYQLGEPRILDGNPNGAHVDCLLTEKFEDGTTNENQIVWVLRREPEIGWRVAGMAVEIVPGTKMQFLNFEDPLDMQKKREEAAAAFAQQEEAATQDGAASQAELPAEPGTGLKNR